MKKIDFIVICFFAFIFIQCGQEKEKKNNPKRPNILLILADDMGYSDLGFMGSGIETPNIDRLGKEGLIFNQIYNTARCCPTRASLLTGLYSHNTGMGWMTASNLGHPGYTGDLNDQCATFAQVLSQYGYKTYMTGKWHVTYDKFMKPDGPKHSWPIQRGFDKYYGHLTGGGGYYHPGNLIYNNEWLEIPDDFYLTTAVSDSTVAFIQHHLETEPDKPFMFYLAYYAPHRPLHAPQKYVSKYRGKFMEGWDVLRERKFNRLKELGMIKDSEKLSARPSDIPAWDSLSDHEKKIWDARMAVYAAMIDCMDEGIGKVLNLLEEKGELDNTVIFFLSDNGGCAEGQGKKDLTDEEILALGNEFPMQSYRKEWANVSNVPFRLYKKDTYEGGISTPMLVRWPNGIKEKNKIVPQMGHVIDLMPTILDLAGAKYPEEINGIQLHPLQGMSLVPAFHGEIFNRGPLFFEHQSNRAVIDGEWKLVSRGTKKPPYTGPWHLYNLELDRTETTDLSDQYPEKVKELSELWDQWASNNNVYPLDARPWNVRIRAGK